MSERNMICIVCPIGCRLKVELDGSSVQAVSGNTCKRGFEYAVKECTHPTRTLTTTVLVEGGDLPVVPVKSAGQLSKELLMDCMDMISGTVVKAPVKAGQVIVRNILQSGVDIVAARDVETRQ